MIKYWLFRLLFPLVGRGHRFAHAIAGMVAEVALLHAPTRRRLVRTYSPLCDGDPMRTREAAGRALGHGLQHYVDLASLHYRDTSVLAGSRLEIRNGERLEVLDGSGPRIIVGGHIAGAELTLHVLPHLGYPFTALVEAVEPPRLAEFMAGWRRAPGARYFPAGPRGLRECVATLRRGGLVALMGDRDIQGNGIGVRFFGRRVRFPAGPWELAARSGAPVLPVLCSKGHGGRIRVSVAQPIRVEENGRREEALARAAQTWAGLLEQHLARDPGQWIVLEDFWRVHACGDG